jgi:hypothetical protein
MDLITPILAPVIWDAAGAEYNLTVAELTLYDYPPTVLCSFISNTSTLDIAFKGAPQTTILVPMSNLVTHNSTIPIDEDGQHAKSTCAFTIGTTDGSDMSGFLGSSFLLSM